MTQDNVLPNILYINDTRTAKFEVITSYVKREPWHKAEEECRVECTVAARTFSVSTIVALMMITTEGVFFGRAIVLTIIRDKHNPALHHYMLKCLEPLKLIHTKELTDRLMNNNEQGQPQPAMQKPAVPYAHPEELAVGDLIKTDICPDGFKYDIQILNAFIVTQKNGEKPSIHNMDSFHLRKDTCATNNSRTFIVWEQLHNKGTSEMQITERHAFAEIMKEHRLFIYKEPDVEDMVKRVLSKGENFPDAVFMSSEAYELIARKPKLACLSPVNGKSIIYYDHVPLYEVKGISGIQVWAGVAHEC